jgi:hypothetical protein
MLASLQASVHEAVQLTRRIDPKKFATQRRLSSRIDGATEEMGSRWVQKDNPLSMVGDQNRIGEVIQARRKSRKIQALRGNARSSRAVSPSCCVA